MTSRSSSSEDAAPAIVVGIGDSGPSHYRAALALTAQMGRQREAELRLVSATGRRGWRRSSFRPALALQTGFAEATARKCPLTAVYVWDLQFSPTFGGSVDPDGEELAEATRWATRFWPTR